MPTGKDYCTFLVKKITKHKNVCTLHVHYKHAYVLLYRNNLIIFFKKNVHLLLDFRLVHLVFS